MKSIVFSENNRSDNLLHIEAPGCIINVRVNLHNDEGHAVTCVEIIPDKYNNDEWDIDGNPKTKGNIVRIIERKVV